MSELYVCEFQFVPGTRKSNCGRCYHSYPHKHKDNCDGDHCKQSNPYNETMKEELTCQPLIDAKEDPVVISNVKYCKGINHETKKRIRK